MVERVTTAPVADELVDSSQTCRSCGMVTLGMPYTCPRCGRVMPQPFERLSRVRSEPLVLSMSTRRWWRRWR
jgi:hypothetical protein